MKHAEIPNFGKRRTRCVKAAAIVAACVAVAVLTWLLDRQSINVDLTAYIFDYGFFVNAVPALLALLVLLTISNRLALSTVVAVILVCAVYAANALKLRYLRTPISFSDVYILQNLHVDTLRLLANYVNVWYLLGGLLLILATATAVVRWEPAFFRPRSLPRLAIAITVIFCLYGVASGAAWTAHVYDAKRLRIIPWSPKLSVLHAGLLSTVVSANAERSRVLDVPIDLHAVDNLVDLPSPSEAISRPADSNAPDIVVIQSESLFDPAILKSVDSTADDLPNLKRALAAGMGGTMKAPTFGGGTLRTEFEVLTGIPMAAYPAIDFPYLQITKRSIPGIVSVVHNAGYKAIAIHGNSGSFWNRSKAFKALGFDQFITAADFPKDAARDGWYYADSAMTDQIILKLKDADKPAFIFAISIEGHGPYLNIPVNDAEERDRLAAPPDLGASGQLEYRNYLYHIKNADQQLGRLWDFLASRNRPYILVFYGDHLPGLQHVYKTAGFDNHDSAPEQYVPWLIVGSDLPTETEHIYSWMLGSDVLSAAGVNLPPYYQLIAKAQAIIQEQPGTPKAEAAEQGVYSLARLYLNGELVDYLQRKHKENGIAPAKSH